MQTGILAGSFPGGRTLDLCTLWQLESKLYCIMLIQNLLFLICRCISDALYEDANNAHERALVFMHKVWQVFLTLTGVFYLITDVFFYILLTFLTNFQTYNNHLTSFTINSFFINRCHGSGWIIYNSWWISALSPEHVIFSIVLWGHCQ